MKLKVKMIIMSNLSVDPDVEAEEFYKKHPKA